MLKTVQTFCSVLERQRFSPEFLLAKCLNRLLMLGQKLRISLFLLTLKSLLFCSNNLCCAKIYKICGLDAFL